MNNFIEEAKKRANIGKEDPEVKKHIQELKKENERLQNILRGDAFSVFENTGILPTVRQIVKENYHMYDPRGFSVVSGIHLIDGWGDHTANFDLLSKAYYIELRWHMPYTYEDGDEIAHSYSFRVVYHSNGNLEFVSSVVEVLSKDQWSSDNDLVASTLEKAFKSPQGAIHRHPIPHSSGNTSM